MSAPRDTVFPSKIAGDRARLPAIDVDFVGEGLRIVTAHWRLIAACVGGALLLAVAASLLLPKTYAVSAQILMLNKRLAEPGALDDGANGYVRYDSPHPEDMQTEIRILESGALVINTLAALQKAGLYTPPPGADPAQPGESPAPLPGTAKDAGLGDLSFAAMPGAYVIDVQLLTGNPRLGAAFLSEFVDQYLDHRQQILANNDELIRQQRSRDFYRARVVEIETRLADLEAKSIAGDVERELELGFQRLEAEIASRDLIQDQLFALSAQKDALEAALAALADSNAPASLPAALTDADLREANQRVAAALSSLNAKKGVYTNSSDAMRSARAAYVSERTSFTALMKRKIEEKYHEIRTLVESVGAKTDRINRQSERNTELRSLISDRQTIAIELEAARKAYLSASARYNAAEASLTSEYNGYSNVRILAGPSEPNEPVSPNLMLNLILGFGAGLGLAGLCVAYREISDPLIRDENDVRRSLGLPIAAAFEARDEQ